MKMCIRDSGKGGGVKIAKDSLEAAELARQMIGMKLVTHQTGPEGRIVQRLLICLLYTSRCV